MSLRRPRFSLLLMPAALILAVATGSAPAFAAVGTVGDSDFLGTAAGLAVLGNSTVTNTGPSVITGDVAVSPGLAITGFPPGMVNGSLYAPPAAQATQGRIDASNAYDQLAMLVGTPVPNDLSGYEYGPGVYTGQPAAGTLELTGTVVLNGGADDVFVFQSASTLITGSNSVVYLTGGARACNVFWLVGSSATLGTNSVMAGTVVARISISATTNATVGSGTDDGARLLALDGAVTLDSNVIGAPSACNDATGGTTAGAAGTAASGADLTAAASFATLSTTAAAAARAANPSSAAPSSGSSSSSSSAASGPALAATGAETGRWVAVGVFVTLVGTVLLLAAARRRRVSGR